MKNMWVVRSRSLILPIYYVPIGLRNMPMFSISLSRMSPGCKNSGGVRAKPTPLGVPVAMMSPARSVIPRDR